MKARLYMLLALVFACGLIAAGCGGDEKERAGAGTVAAQDEPSDQEARDTETAGETGGTGSGGYDCSFTDDDGEIAASRALACTEGETRAILLVVKRAIELGDVAECPGPFASDPESQAGCEEWAAGDRQAAFADGEFSYYEPKSVRPYPDDPDLTSVEVYSPGGELRQSFILRRIGGEWKIAPPDVQ